MSRMSKVYCIFLIEKEGKDNTNKQARNTNQSIFLDKLDTKCMKENMSSRGEFFNIGISYWFVFQVVGRLDICSCLQFEGLEIKANTYM